MISFASVQKTLAVPQSQIFPPGKNNSQFTGFPQGSVVLKCRHLELPWQGTRLLPVRVSPAGWIKMTDCGFTV